jgi:hypothetical protein
VFFYPQAWASPLGPMARVNREIIEPTSNGAPEPEVITICRCQRQNVPPVPRFRVFLFSFPVSSF